MADVKSALITKFESDPRSFVQPWEGQQVVRTTGPGVVAVTASEDSGDKLFFARISSSARLLAALISNTTVPSSGAINIGLYQTTEDGGAAVDEDFIASARAVTTATTNLDLTHESGQFAVSERSQRIWEALGLSEDPGVYYDIIGTITTDMGGAGAICIECLYVDGA